MTAHIAERQSDTVCLLIEEQSTTNEAALPKKIDYKCSQNSTSNYPFTVAQGTRNLLNATTEMSTIRSRWEKLYRTPHPVSSTKVLKEKNLKREQWRENL